MTEVQGKGFEWRTDAEPYCYHVSVQCRQSDRGAGGQPDFYRNWNQQGRSKINPEWRVINELLAEEATAAQ